MHLAQREEPSIAEGPGGDSQKEDGWMSLEWCPGSQQEWRSANHREQRPRDAFGEQGQETEEASRARQELSIPHPRAQTRTPEP